MDAIEALRLAYPFQDCSAADVLALLPQFERANYDAGAMVWQAGDPSDHLWFVLDGQLRYVITNADGDEVITQMVGRGESFGEPALFVPNTRRIGTCVAVTSCDLMRLRREHLLEFLEAHPAAMRRMLESLGRMILSQTSLFSLVAFQDVRGRVAYQILKLADEYGEKDGAETKVALKLSQATLAGLVASSRESVNRALSAFLKAGAIRLDDGHIYVVDPRLLRAELSATL